jgi:DNA-binding XRE family transcriptional regulator
MDKEAMAINLRRIRHERQIRQEELAHLSGISARYAGSIERTDKSASVTPLIFPINVEQRLCGRGGGRSSLSFASYIP